MVHHNGKVWVMNVDDFQQALVENCQGNKGNLGEPGYEEGYYFCAGCGAQFDDPDHGIALMEMVVTASREIARTLSSENGRTAQ